MGRKYYIYKHTSPSGKVYIGQTVNPRKRWEGCGNHYKNKKIDGCYTQPVFARAIDKYGWNNFTHEIILELDTKSETDYAEKYLIKWYKLHKMSYNITDGGEGCCGIKHPMSEERRKAQSERLKIFHPMRGKHHTPEALAKIIYANQHRVYTEEQKKAMSERARLLRLGFKVSDETRKKQSNYRKAHPETWVGGWNKKEVHQYDLNGNYMASYISASEASISLTGKECCGDILKCIEEKVASAFGFVWRDTKVNHIDLSRYKIVKTKRGARLIDMSYEGRMKRRKGHGKPVNQYSLDGKYLATYNSTIDASEHVGVDHTAIGRCCLHKLKAKSAKGFLWEYDTGDNRRDKINI